MLALIHIFVLVGSCFSPLALSRVLPCRRFEMDREPHEARFCAECNKRHGAEEGDLWAESSMLGLKITYFAFMDGKVYDITGIWNITQLTSLIYTGSYPASDLYWEVGFPG